MKFKMKQIKEIDVKYLQVQAGVRYWEDAEVNQEEDEEGTLIPFRVGDYWEPVINLDLGKIEDWPSGTTANIHYKVCDDGVYTILDSDKNKIKSIEGYVPNIMCPSENGFGDYIIMKIDSEGNIEDFKCRIDEFNED